MKKLARVVALVLAVALLASVPGSVGCGREEGRGNEVVIGWEWDLTGRAALAVVQVYDALRDYLTLNTVPGVDIKVVPYDAKSDPARVPGGYEWLKGRGLDVLSAAPQDVLLLRSRLEADQIPVFQVSNILATLDSDWIFSEYGPPESQLEVELQWITDTWEGAEKAKVGFVGLSGVPFYESQRDKVEAWVAEHPDDFEWLGAEMAPSTTTS